MYNPNGFKDKKTGKVRNTMVNNVTPKKTVIYENLVKCIYHEQCQDFRFPDGAMLDMRILAYYGIPKSKSKKIKEQMAKGLLRPIKKPTGMIPRSWTASAENSTRRIRGWK